MIDWKRWAALAVVAVLSSCGGGGGETGNSVFGNGNGSSTAKAADITLTLTSNTISNSGSETVTATVTAVDANRNTVAGIPVTLSVDNGATIQVSGTQTDDKGVVTGAVSIGASKVNRTITIAAASGSLSRSVTIQVVGTKIAATLLPAVLDPGTPGKVQYKVLDVNGAKMDGIDVVINGPSGLQTTGKTWPNGDFELSYTAPATPGTYAITALAGGAQYSLDLLVQSGQGAIPPAVALVQSASVSANPNVVQVNSASTANQATIRALFLSANNAPVKNIRVRFDLGGDPFSIGGSVASGTSIVYSDSNGIATTAYSPGARSSNTDGVIIRACWDYADFSVGACPNATTSNLTVVSEPLNVSIGTGRLIESDPLNVVYIKKFVVQVVDASGQAKQDAPVSAAIDLLRFRKGFYIIQGAQWTQQLMAVCDNEDLNRNGVAETFSNGVVEDANGSQNLSNGRPALEPRKADVTLSFVAGSKTDATGKVVLQIQYPQNIASWVDFNIVVSAGVSGTEGRANFEGTLPVPGEVIQDLKNTPPFELSPYGVQTSPTTAASLPGSSKVSMLCTNPL